MKKTIIMMASVGILTFSGAYANTNLNGDIDNVTVTLVNDNISSLCKAAMQGDVDKVRSLIATGKNVNEKSLGMTPAMFAARYNKPEVLKVLMLNKASLSIKSDQGYTVKDYAKMSKAKEVLQVIDSNS